MFFRNFLTINAFAIFGTIIAGFSFSLIFWQGTSYTYYAFDYLHSLQFGFFISAIDPVATISIFRALNVNAQIYTIVFGESTLNDAAAIALSKSTEHM
jgi:NhaP-type Na+/H+ or K+/H+ antiporter